MPIYLPEILPVFAPEEYKLHFAQHNDTEQPLDVFVRSREEWQGWQAHQPRRNEFNRRLIFSLARFYHEPDVWLFGGIYRVVVRHPHPDGYYEVELADQAEEYIGCLMLRRSHRRPIRPKLETYYRSLEVLRILPEPYLG